jgi:hypothetical protein
MVHSKKKMKAKTHIIQKPNRHHRHTPILRLAQNFPVQPHRIPRVLGAAVPVQTAPAVAEMVGDLADELARDKVAGVEKHGVAQWPPDPDRHVAPPVVAQDPRHGQRRVARRLVDVDGEQVGLGEGAGEEEGAGVAERGVSSMFDCLGVWCGGD